MASSALPCEEMASSRLLERLSSFSLMSPPRRRFPGGGFIVTKSSQTIAISFELAETMSAHRPRIKKDWERVLPGSLRSCCAGGSRLSHDPGCDILDIVVKRLSVRRTCLDRLFSGLRASSWRRSAGRCRAFITARNVFTLRIFPSMLSNHAPLGARFII
jgi:hypothetical protein